MSGEKEGIWLSDVAQVEGAANPAAAAWKTAMAKAKELRETDAFLQRSRSVTAAVNEEAAGTWSRVMEVIAYAKGMGYKRLGIAFCAGLAAEAETLAEILRGHGFTVHGVKCSVDGPCNSAGQALLLNTLGTDFNIMMGLCVGHDAAFLRFSEAPVTPLAVKDKVTCHNPMAALYCGYQKKRLAAGQPS